MNEAEYLEAKKRVIAYEEAINRATKIRLKSFEEELSILFKNNEKLIIDEFKLEENFMEIYSIIPLSPNLEECYEGELNDEIELLCQKHKIKAKMIYWCYPK
jgi:hypothetical protein